MDDKRLLIDFGSTFTKVVYIDLYRNEVLSRVQSNSTVESDITEGLTECINQISKSLNIDNLSSTEALACSSAAGGLRIACVGFVPDYSSKAANLAAMGAGAKVVGCYSFEISRREIEELKILRPDIILLTGGTDGGDKKVIIHNARILADHEWGEVVFVVAGNKTAIDDIETIFMDHRHSVVYTKNVMPELDRLDVDSCNKVIRDIFINNIIDAKGIGKAKSIIKNVLMPTPSAVLDAARLLSQGYSNEPGLGELIIVDVGGATTDVHSAAEGRPSRSGATQKGLPEPYVKRTVEGDLGLRFNIDKLLEILKDRGYASDLDKDTEYFSNPGLFPENRVEIELHTVLSHLAVEVAVERHVGRIEVKYGPMGEMLLQYGKDLSDVGCIIGTGGPIVFSKDPRDVLEGALYQEDKPNILKPRSSKFYIDKDYILYAGGLLSKIEPEKALMLMKKYLVEV